MRIMHYMLMVTQCFHIVGVDTSAQNVQREAWALNRRNNLHYDMVQYWPTRSLDLQNKLYVKHFRVDMRPFCIKYG